MIEGTGQPLYPAIRFEDGSWYREESEDMARTIREGRLIEKEMGSVPGVVRFLQARRPTASWA
jgi:hypothetical protein